MSFSAEINDFVKGFAAGAGVGLEIKKAKLDEKKFAADQANDERNFNEKKRQFDLGYGLDQDKMGLDREKMGLDREKFGFEKSKSAEEFALRKRALELEAQGQSATEAYRNATLELQRQQQEDVKARGNRALDIQETGQNQTHQRGTEALGIRKTEAERKATDAKKAETEADMESLLPPDMRGAKAPAAAPTTYVDDYDLDGDGVIDDDADGDGSVKAYAQGGLVDPDEEKKEEAIPTEPAQPQVNREVKSNRGADPVIKQAQIPIMEAMKSFTEESKAPAAKPAALDVEPGKKQDRITIDGEGAATPEEIKAIDSKIDPEGQLEPYRKGAARLVTAYNFFVEKGEPEKARAIAKRIIAYDKLATQTLGKLAQNAAESGDVQSASKLLVDAYNNHVPDGRMLSAEPTPRGTVIYKIDQGAETMDQGEVGRRELWALAAKVADGSEFIDRMADIAGAAADEPATSAGNSGGKKGSYSQDVAAAATAKKTLDALQKQYASVSENSAGVEGADGQAAALKSQLDAAAKNYTAAMQRAEQAAMKTKRPREVLISDLERELKVASAIPAEGPPAGAAPAAEEKSGARWWFPAPVVAAYDYATSKGTPVKLTSKEEYDKLPSGTPYTAPDGSQRTKP